MKMKLNPLPKLLTRKLRRAASGFYVKAEQDFSVEFVYHGPDGSELRKTLQVKLGESKVAAKAAANAGAGTYAAGPTPPFTTGKITSISFEGGTWLIWFNGIEAYCCSHGLNGQPNGLPHLQFFLLYPSWSLGNTRPVTTMPTR